MDWFYKNLKYLLELKVKKDFIGDWNAKIRTEEIHGVIGKFGFGVQNEAGQSLTEFVKRKHWS